MHFDILFLGKLFPKDLEYGIKKKMKTGMQDAGNALQWNIIDGLDSNKCGTIKILDYLPVDSYPNGYVDRIIEEHIFQHSEKYKSDDKIVKCTNLTVIKQFANLGVFKKEIKQWIESVGEERKILISFTASTMFLQLAKYAKKLSKDVMTCCIIADLPEFLSASELHGIKKAFNQYEMFMSDRLYKYIDKFILLTAQMADKLKLKSPFIVMEGIAPDDRIETDSVIERQYKDVKYILYSGTLNYKFGIGTLLEAFSKIEDENLKLMICGFGEAEEIIKKTDDKRIIFLGKMDRRQVIALQRNATVLVNPRQNNEEFTKYSFPSKTMEYLASGVPIVAYKLDGIPDEYDDYICYVSDNTPETLAKTIEEMCKKTNEERRIIGEAAKKFVMMEKNSNKQTKRILDFLEDES